MLICKQWGEVMVMNKKCVLVVDDMATNRRVAKNFLNVKDIEIFEAKNGQEAVDIFKEKQDVIDLILMDVAMPVMDGYEATKKIREFSSVPIIALTAHAYQEDVDQALESGMNFHLAKPIEAETFFEVIERFI